MKKILMVLTSVSEIGDTGEKTGYNVAEAAHPWKVFKDSGHFVDFASIQGGQPPRDEVDSEIQSRSPSRRTRPRVPVSTTLPASTSLIPTSTTPSSSWVATAPCGTFRTAKACRTSWPASTTPGLGWRGLPRTGRPAERGIGERASPRRGPEGCRLHQRRGGCRGEGQGHPVLLWQTDLRNRAPLTSPLLSLRRRSWSTTGW